MAGLFYPSFVRAGQLEMNTALLQAMDKITGRVSEIEVPVNGEVKFGSFSIVVRSCQTTPPEETPENYAFVDVADTAKDGKLFNIFKGWMMSSSPALNAVEHPIYDVWLLKCINKNVNKEKLLSQEALLDRDGLPRKEDVIKENSPSREAIIAEEAKAEAKASEAEEKNFNKGENNSEKQDVNSAEIREAISQPNTNQELLQDEDKLPVVSEIIEEKTIEKAVEPAQALENSEVDAEKINNAPQPLLPNLNDDQPQKLITFPEEPQKTEEAVNAENVDQTQEIENTQPVLLEKEQVKEVMEQIEIPNTNESISESPKTQVKEEIPADTSDATVLVPMQEDIPVEEDQFIEEDVAVQ